ncbi:MAG: insulinase family protein [Alphaproteobacteria bacterium]|nr:insulinase family protein [Alphaproteobacteria bacterium]
MRLPLAALAAALLLATSPVAAEPRAETFTLANGLQVVVIPDHRVAAVTHMVWYRVGAADDPPGKSGIAHFLEHLMFKGTAMLAPGAFSRTIAANGGRDNAFTSQDYTGYFQRIAKDRLELVMGMEADRMVNLRLTDPEVLPERDVVLEERRSRTDNEPSALLREQASVVQFFAHPYGRPVIGWEHEIRGLTTADALDFYRRHYGPNNAILVVAGDVTAAEVRPLAEKHFGPLPARALGARARLVEPPQRAARRVEYRDARVRHPTWARSFLAPSLLTGGAATAAALDVLAEILGGDATSRLYRTLVVDGGLATSAGAYYDDVQVDQTTFHLSASPRPGVTMAALEAAIEAEIQRLLQHGVDAAEVGRARDRLQAQAIFGRDSTMAVARRYGATLAVGGTLADVEEREARLDQVTAEAVTAAARAVLVPERSVTSLLLPKEGA